MSSILTLRVHMASNTKWMVQYKMLDVKRSRTTAVVAIPSIFIQVGRYAVANFTHPSYGSLFLICLVRPQLIPNLKYIHQKRDIMPLFHILVISFLPSPTALISLSLVISEFFPLLVGQKIFYKGMESGGLLRR